MRTSTRPKKKYQADSMVGESPCAATVNSTPEEVYEGSPVPMEDQLSASSPEVKSQV
jgi:hypothetical protein